MQQNLTRMILEKSYLACRIHFLVFVFHRLFLESNCGELFSILLHCMAELFDLRLDWSTGLQCGHKILQLCPWLTHKQHHHASNVSTSNTMIRPEIQSNTHPSQFKSPLFICWVSQIKNSRFYFGNNQHTKISHYQTSLLINH